MLEKTPDTSLRDTVHPFDRATQVIAADGGWRGEASADYFAFVGPFGGATAATMLRAKGYLAAVRVPPQTISGGGKPLAAVIIQAQGDVLINGAPLAAGLIAGQLHVAFVDASGATVEATRTGTDWTIATLSAQGASAIAMATGPGMSATVATLGSATSLWRSCQP